MFELFNFVNFDELYCVLVEVMWYCFGFDWFVFLLFDMKKCCFSGIYGIDEYGNMIDE